MKIAIVGGGIAGASTAYYLSKNNKYQIDLYEMNSQLGGRVYTHEKYRIDQGAEFFISGNINLLKLIDDLNSEEGIHIEKEEYLSARAILQIKKKRSVILPSKKQGFVSRMIKQFKMLSYIGMKNVSSLTRIKKLVDEFETVTTDLFNLIENADTPELFDAVSKKYTDLISVSLAEYFLEQGLSQDIIDNFIDPLVSTVYMLDVNELNAFHGAMIFAAKNNIIYHIKNGNSELFYAFDKYFADVNNVNIKLNHQLIEFNTNTLELRFDPERLAKYDFVFLAMPHKNIAEININGDILSVNNYRDKTSDLKHHSIYHHLISGEPVLAVARLFSKGADTIFTGTNTNIWEINFVKDGIYDITAKSAFDDTDFDIYFENYESINTKFWNPSYPLYIPDNMKLLPTSMYMADNIAIGTEFLISSLDSGILIAKRVRDMVIKFAE